jgi:hypothetical protein
MASAHETTNFTVNPEKLASKLFSSFRKKTLTLKTKPKPALPNTISRPLASNEK